MSHSRTYDKLDLLQQAMMGDERMRKAELLDDLRAEIGVVADRLEEDLWELYRFVIRTLYEKVTVYQYVGIYLCKETQFENLYHEGFSSLPPIVRFGEGFLSLAAARGGMVREQIGSRTEVYVPFYRGHHLIGQLVVISDPYDGIDEEDLALFCELASLFESKIEERSS